MISMAFLHEMRVLTCLGLRATEVTAHPLSRADLHVHYRGKKPKHNFEPRESERALEFRFPAS